MELHRKHHARQQAHQEIRQALNEMVMDQYLDDHEVSQFDLLDEESDRLYTEFLDDQFADALNQDERDYYDHDLFGDREAMDLDDEYPGYWDYHEKFFDDYYDSGYYSYGDDYRYPWELRLRPGDPGYECFRDWDAAEAQADAQDSNEFTDEEITVLAKMNRQEAEDEQERWNDWRLREQDRILSYQFDRDLESAIWDP